MLSKLAWLVGALLALSVAQAQAATYYVSTTGNDANDGSLASPWRNICYATGGGGYTWTTSPADRVACATTNPSKLAAGDTLQIRGGTYQENYITFANSGSAGSVILVTQYSSETPIIDGGYTTSSGRNPVWWIDNRHYLTFDHLTIRRGSQSNIYIAYDFDTTHITIQYCEFQDVVTDDNTGHIYAESGFDYLTIQYNRIHGKVAGTAYGTTTGDGIKVWYGKHLVIRHNEIFGTGVNTGLLNGIYYKQTTDSADYGNVIENNVIHTTSRVGIDLSASPYMTIRNNLIYNTGGILLFEESATCNALLVNDVKILHNTLIPSATGKYGVNVDRSEACVGAINAVVRDNLLSGFTDTEFRGITIYAYWPPKWAASTVYALTETFGANPAVTTYRRTKDTNTGRKFKVTTAGTSAATEPSATCWTSSSPPPGCTVTDGTVVWTEDGASDVSNTTIEYNLVNSSICSSCLHIGPLYYAITSPPSTVLGNAATNLNAAPVFVDSANNNYTLTAASPGYKAASDGTDMGARICLVGTAPTCNANDRTPLTRSPVTRTPVTRTPVAR